MEYLIGLVVGYLQIKRPYTITISSKSNRNTTAEYIAWYVDGAIQTSSYLIDHDIKIYFRNFASATERSIEAIIVHEFIHAWQAENDITEIHGEQFQQMAKDLYKFLIKNGITNIENIYNPELDT